LTDLPAGLFRMARCGSEDESGSGPSEEARSDQQRNMTCRTPAPGATLRSEGHGFAGGDSGGCGGRRIGDHARFNFAGVWSESARTRPVDWRGDQSRNRNSRTAVCKRRTALARREGRHEAAGPIREGLRRCPTAGTGFTASDLQTQLSKRNPPSAWPGPSRAERRPGQS